MTDAESLTQIAAALAALGSVANLTVSVRTLAQSRDIHVLVNSKMKKALTRIATLEGLLGSRARQRPHPRRKRRKKARR